MSNRVMSALTLVLALGALAVGLSACGGSGGGGSETSSSGPVSPSDVNGKVTVWDPFPSLSPVYAKAVKPVDAAFERAFPNVTVDHVSQSFENYEALLQAAFTGHEGPDVMILSPAGQGVLRWRQGLEQLNGRISDEMNSDLQFWSAVTPEYTEDQEAPRFGIPVGLTDEAFIYYNKKLFKKAGLPTDFQPKTWDDIKVAGEKLEAAGIQAFAGGNKEGYENDFWLLLGWPSYGTSQQAIELSNGEIPFTDKVVEEAYGPEIAMQEAGLYPADRFSTPLWPDGVSLFEEEHAGMTAVVGTSLFELSEKLGEKTYGLVSPPGGKYGQIGPNFGASIPKFAENKEAAWAYVEFLASQEAEEIYLEKSGLLPNRDDVELPPDVPAQVRQMINIPNEYETTLPPLAQMIPGQVLATLRTEISQVLQGRQSLPAALSAGQETAEKSTE